MRHRAILPALLLLSAASLSIAASTPPSLNGEGWLENIKNGNAYSISAATAVPVGRIWTVGGGTSSAKIPAPSTAAPAGLCAGIRISSGTPAAQGLSMCLIGPFDSVRLPTLGVGDLRRLPEPDAGRRYVRPYPYVEYAAPIRVGGDWSIQSSSASPQGEAAHVSVRF